ncbi:copper chaperone PCu(A)C [Bdellovibrio bacteriovorus]|uniref:copper chaperone PCu(A)C n=1 Tax=Bdellovibrio bacteriovorus TaxID=959 RepID=UPI0035A57315
MKAIVLAALTVALSPVAFAAKSAVTISDARIFAPIKGTNATAGYGVITNTTDKEVTVTVEKIEPFKAVEMHETVEKDGRMSMQKVEKLTIPAKKSAELKPGGNHIMLFDPTREVKADETLKVSLKVNGKIESFDFKVIPRVETKKEEHHHHH